MPHVESPMEPLGELYLTSRQAAKATGLSTARIRAAAEDGIIAGQKIGNEWQLLLSAVIAYVDRHNAVCESHGVSGAIRDKSACPYCDSKFRTWIGLKLHMEDQH